ncbi:MAG: threonylcarbamoyl-AMP synthase [Elusimicrobia bacterium]|nr:threonylcarbamoyl-AMP synthase [Elusimicrobiota bacterium]
MAAKLKTLPHEIKQIAGALRRGYLVIFPTETVYALAADGLDAGAKRRIYLAKGRAFDKPLQLLLPDAALIARYIDRRSLKKPLHRLAKRLWPGPLTVVFKANALGRRLSGGPTIGIRVPDHALARTILRLCKRPVLATSANRSGGPEPVRLRDIPAMVKKAAKYIAVEPEQIRRRNPSTVLDASVSPPRILREGAITQQKIERLLNRQ